MSIEDQTEQLARAMAQMQATVESVTSSMATVALISQKTAKSMAGEDAELKKLTEGLSGVTRRTGELTEAEKSRLVAIEREKEAKARLDQATKTAVQSIGAFGAALLDTTNNLSKYGGAIGKAGDAALQLGKSMGGWGTAIGLAVKGATALAEAQLKQADNGLKARDSLTKMGGAGAHTTESIVKMGIKAGLSSDNLDKLIKPMQGLGSNLLVLGGNAGEAQKRFADLAAVTSEQRKEMNRLGISQEEMIKGQADFVALQAAAGRNVKGQFKDTDALRKASLDYQKNLLELATITGEDVEEIKKKQQAALQDRQLMITERQDQIKAERLTRQAAELRAKGDEAGAQAAEQQAQKIKDEAKARSDLIAATASIGSDTLTKGLRQFLATGTIAGEEAAALAAQGMLDNVMAAGKAIKEGVAPAEAAARLQDQYNEQFDKNIESMGEAAKHSDEVAKVLDVSEKTLAMTNQQRDRNLEAEKKAAGEAVQGQAEPGQDKAADARAAATEATIQASVALEKLVLATNPLMGEFNLLKAASAALTVAAVAATAALGAFAAKQGLGKVMDTIKGIGGKGAGAVARGAGTAARAAGTAAAGTAAAGTAAAGTAAAGTAAAGTAAAGGLSKMLKGGARVLGKVAAPLAIGMTAYDAFKGFTADKDATLGEKFKNAGSSALSGLTFGMLGKSPEEIAEAKAAKEAEAKESKDATNTATPTDPTIDTEKKPTDIEPVNKLFGELAKTTGQLVAQFQQLNSQLKTLGNSLPKQTLQTTESPFKTVRASMKGGMPNMEELQKTMMTGGMPNMEELQKTMMTGGMPNMEELQKAIQSGNTEQIKQIQSMMMTGTMSPLSKSMQMPSMGGMQMPAMKETSGGGMQLPSMGGGMPMPPATVRKAKASNAGGGGDGGGFIDQVMSALGFGGSAAGDSSAGEEWTGGSGDMAPPAGISKPTGGGGGGNMSEQDIKDMIIKHEGIRYRPYKDSLGLWTVGVGHLIGDGKSLPAAYNREFSHDEVMAMFDKDYDKHKKQAESNVPGFSKYDSMGQAAFIDLTFNMGPGWPRKFKNTSKKIEQGDTEGAARGLEDSLWYKQVKSRGPTIVSMVENAKVMARDGGLAMGPESGYPATLHGNEMIVPLDPNSILAELGKKSSAEIQSQLAEKTSQIQSLDPETFRELAQINQSMMDMMANKLDAVISRLETSNDTQDKLLKYSQA